MVFKNSKNPTDTTKMGETLNEREEKKFEKKRRRRRRRRRKERTPTQTLTRVAVRREDDFQTMTTTTTSDEEEETMLDSEEEEEEEEDSDEEYELSQRDKNLVRERNVKALRDGTVKIAYASVLSNLKPPEPNEVILKRHFQPLVPGGALQTGRRSLVERATRLHRRFFIIFFSFRTILSPQREEKSAFRCSLLKKKTPFYSLSLRVSSMSLFSRRF